MSNLQNDQVLEEIMELLPELDRDQQIEVNKLLTNNELEEALFAAKYYRDPIHKAYINELIDLNKETIDGNIY